MKRRWSGPILTGALLLFLTACQTDPGYRGLAEERLVPVGPDEAFRESWALLTERGYRFRRHEPAAGYLEAFSRVDASAPFGDAVQRRVRVWIEAERPGHARVRLAATRLEESDIPVHGRATFERPMTDPWYYELFFTELAARLDVEIEKK